MIINNWANSCVIQLGIFTQQFLFSFALIEKNTVYLLTKWEGWMGKYLAQGYGV